jgi:hypothetical protein
MKIEICPKVGEMWLVQGETFQDLMMIQRIDGSGYRGVSLDCSDHAGYSGNLLANEHHLVSCVEAEDGKQK